MDSLRSCYASRKEAALRSQSDRKFGRSARVCLIAFLLLPAMCGAQIVAPPVQPVPEQPIPFSHKTHVAFQLACTYCHTNPDPGNQMNFPAAERCMGCHARVAKDRPAIQQLAKAAQSGEPIHWKQLYSVPSFVYWSHRTHSDARVGCTACHGDVAQMEVTAKVTNVTTMAGCVGCHRQKQAATGCETCHESQSSLLRSK